MVRVPTSRKKQPTMNQSLASRITSLEQWKQEQEIEVALIKERRATTDERFDRVEKRLDKIDGHVSRLVWLVVAAILSAIVTFTVKGGFT